MNTIYTIYFFILGIVFGSFFNVVGYRLPKEQSIVNPPSHCPKCNHKLKFLELIPIFSFLIQGGKCRNCKQKISWFYTIFELLTGVLFALAYLRFGISNELITALVFISMSIIIIISDYQTFIIPDEILVFAGCFFLTFILVNSGVDQFLISLLSGIISFLIMYALKKVGDLSFKKESMGGGDLKLMFIFGIVFGYQLSIVVLFLASIIGLPISIIILKIKKTNIIPFGPFLCIAALILLFFNFNFNDLINYLFYS